LDRSSSPLVIGLEVGPWRSAEPVIGEQTAEEIGQSLSRVFKLLAPRDIDLVTQLGVATLRIGDRGHRMPPRELPWDIESISDRVLIAFRVLLQTSVEASGAERAGC
jgi:hypothetical protein